MNVLGGWRSDWNLGLLELSRVSAGVRKSRSEGQDHDVRMRTSTRRYDDIQWVKRQAVKFASKPNFQDDARGKADEPFDVMKPFFTASPSSQRRKRTPSPCSKRRWSFPRSHPITADGGSLRPLSLSRDSFFIVDCST